MNTDVPGVRRKIFKSKIIVRWVAIGLIVLLAAGAVYTFITIRKGKSAANAQQQQTARVIKGNLSISITGSAPITSSNRRELSPKVTSKITKVYFKEGDNVKAGDVLFELDDTDAQLNVENTKNSIAQTQLTQTNNQKSVTGLNVKAPFSGQVTNIQAKSGDTIGKGASILTITDNSRLKVTLPFNGSGVAGISVGQKATVNLQDLMQSVDGVVTYISSKPYTTASGGELYNVEITIENPGSLQEGMKANADITTSSEILSSVESSTLACINSTIVRSDAGGTIQSVNVMENQYVNAGDILLKLQNDDLKLTLDTTDLKIQSLQRQLQIQQEQLTYYKIAAPCDGEITSQTSIEGDTVKPGDVMAVVADMGHMEFSVTIDELDIAKVQVGQKVNITVDALPETSTTPLTGQVIKTAMEGTSSNGVTTYPVTISINETDKLKAGMNANADILISDKQNVLMVPLEAVQKMGNRSFVWVRSNGKTTGSSGFGQWGGNGINGQRNRNGANGSGAQSGNQAQGAQSGNTRQGAQGNNTAQGARNGNTQQGAQNGNTRQGMQNGNAAQGFRRNAAAINSYYANATIMPVQTGINNDTFIEITSGLQEGDVVILPQTTTSSGQQSATQNRSGFGGGGMGGMFGGITGGGGGGGNNRAQNFQRGD